jgi:hypothetical protein
VVNLGAQQVFFWGAGIAIGIFSNRTLGMAKESGNGQDLQHY